MKKVEYLIIGNSAGGIGAAEAIRHNDKAGEIAIISDEPYAAYSRVRIAEHLADKTYRLELAGERGYRIWAYRKAAWALDELEQDVRLIYERMGVKGLESIPSLGKKLAREVEQQIHREASERRSSAKCIETSERV